MERNSLGYPVTLVSDRRLKQSSRGPDNIKEIDSYNNYTSKRRDSAHKDRVFKKKSMVGDSSRELKSRIDYKSKIEEEVENKIKEKTRSKRFLLGRSVNVDKRDSLRVNKDSKGKGTLSPRTWDRDRRQSSSGVDTVPGDSFYKRGSGTTMVRESLQAVKKSLSKLCGGMNQEIYEGRERGKIQEKLQNSKDLKEMFAILFHLLDGKVEKLFGQKKLLHSDKSLIVC